MVRVLPEEANEALVRYLASPPFPSVGPQAARPVLEVLGPGAIARVAKDLDCMLAVEALGGRQVQVRLTDGPQLHQARVELLRLGLHLELAERVIDRYGAAAPGSLPRRAGGAGPGLPLGGPGRAAAGLRAHQPAPGEVDGAIIWVLAEAVKHEGHTCLPHGLLVQDVDRLLRGEGEEAPEASPVEAVLH